MDYSLKELLDIPRLLELLDSLDEIHSMPSAVIDTEGNVLIATAWQDICTNFHRVSPETEKMCIESDRNIEARLGENTSHIVYRCPMGLVDSATPIIVDGKYLGNVFSGQLFMEPPDEAYFINQARQYGFDECEYLAAMRKVPLFSEEQLHKNLNFIAKLAQMLAEQGLQYKRQCEAEQALKESENFLRELQIIAGLGSYSLDFSSGLWRSSEILDTVFGIDKTYERSIAGWEALIHPDDYTMMIDYFDKDILGKGHNFDKEYRIIRHNDQMGRWVHGLGKLGLDTQGCPAIMHGTIQDITGQKQAQSYADMGREVLQILNESAAPQDAIQRVLAVLQAQTGFDAVGIRLQVGEDFPYFAAKGFPEDFLLKENSLIVHTADEDVCRDKDGNVLLDCTCGLVLSGTADPAHPLFTAGGSFWTNDSFPLLDIPPDEDPRINPRNLCIHDGYASVALVPIRNKTAIVGLIQLNDKRKGCFTLHTVELLEGIASHIGEALMRKKAEKELQKKDAEIEQFIYSVSHDLRSPLVTVKTFMGYLEKDMASGNQESLAQDIQYIHSAADKMKLLLDELLELSRIDRVEAPPVRVSFMEVLAEVVDILAGVISERNVDIHLPEIDQMLFGDRQRLHQIWQNLIENAIKYSRDDSFPRVELGVQQVGGKPVFFVRDNGIGVDSHYHSKIFGIFEKLDPKSPGAGLGLSMVQRIVEKCGGRIWVESEGEGKGSCFFFTLPHAVVQR
jgi:signal transduction histidine kinase/ligand-binding sensor protein